jgi:hypothetical protein
MVERERTHTPHGAGDPLPASLPFILTCEQCNGSLWHAATIDETSIVYHCARCHAPVRITYSAATRSWTMSAL